MYLDEIELTFFEQHEHLIVKPSSLFFIKGLNGSGKSTLGLDAVLFCLWGYLPNGKVLTDIPTRNKSKTASVRLSIRKGMDQYVIIRQIPTKIEMFENGVALELNNAEIQNKINTLFGDVNNFKKFRTVDKDQGVNFVDPKSAVSLKKIVFALSEEVFNEKKLALEAIKKEREDYNKDKLSSYSFYPSEKRLELLKLKKERTKEEYQQKQEEMQELEVSLREIEKKISSQESDKRNINSTNNNIRSQIQKMSNNKCYVCGTILDISKNKAVIEKLQLDIKENEEKIKKIDSVLMVCQEEKKELNDLLLNPREELNKINNHVLKISELILKLSDRIKQKDFKYTNRDVEIAKQAIKELDYLSTRYLVTTVKKLEPIINNIFSKIGYSLEFDVNDKGKFDIVLKNEEGTEFHYRDLSQGQKMMLDISVKLAILMEQGQEGLIIADEGLGSLDSSNLAHILKIFKALPFQLIFIVHHVEDLDEDIQTFDLNNKKETEEKEIKPKRTKKLTKQ